MWKGKEIEEVRDKILRICLSIEWRTRGTHKRQSKKGNGNYGTVWSIGKRKFGKDVGKRIWLFDALVWTVLSYGAEIWGWKEREKMERVEERFLK